MTFEEEMKVEQALKEAHEIAYKFGYEAGMRKQKEIQVSDTEAYKVGYDKGWSAGYRLAAEGWAEEDKDG